MVKKIKWLILIAFIAIQFVPYGKEHTNPPVVNEPQWDTQRTKEIFEAACMDCHSNETKWPWYSKIAPVSWLVHHDVEEGRERFNVSMWEVQKKNEGNEAAKEVREGEMPMFGYLLAHPEAKLSKEEKEELVKGLVATFGEKKDDED